MGLAASQARFLNLTARKTNLEYEGQQINQQRTTLSNQSASYYNSMLTLTVPTPPSTDSYKKIVYTLSVNGNTYNINQITRSSSKDLYTVNYTTTYEGSSMVKKGNRSVINDSGFYYVGSKSENNKINTISTYVNNHTDVWDTATKRTDYINGILAEFNDNKEGTVYTASDIYMINLNEGKETAPNYVYFLKKDLENYAAGNVNYYGEGSVTKYETGSWSNVSIERGSNNRIVSMIIPELTGSNTENAVTATSITDEDAYTDAYNEYQYQTYLYQQRMEEINAQTSIIQAKDKKLELRLKQLDTEENAIKTEMDSINSVLKDNIDKSFKTFA